MDAVTYLAGLLHYYINRGSPPCPPEGGLNCLNDSVLAPL